MGFSIGALYMTLFADGGRLQQSIEQEATKAADAAGQKAGVALGTRMAQGFAKAGKTLQTTGASLTRNITLPLVGVGAAVIAVGTQFDTTLRQIVALTDVTGDEIGGIRKRLLELGPALGKTPQELAEGFYFLASAGFTTAESLTVLETTAKASAAGLGTTADVSRVVGAAINAFGKENLTAVDATDQLVRAVKNGTAEAPEFAGALGDVLGSAGQVGATFADTTAAIAAMTLKGINANEAATSLNQVFMSLIKTTPQAEEALQGLGLSSAGLRTELREKGLLSVLGTLSERFAGNETAAAAVFGNVRALRGILALTTGDATATAKVFDDVANGATTLADAFAETEGPGREMDRAMAEVQVTLISLAVDVLPPFTDLLREVVKIVHSGVEVFKSLPEPVRSGIVQILALAAALGPLLFITGKVASGIGLLGNAFNLLAPKIASAVLATGPGAAIAGTGVGTMIGGAISAAIPLALVAAAGIGIALAFKAIFLDPGLQQQTRDIGTSVGKQIVEGATDELEISKSALEKGIADINALPLGGFLYGDQVRDLQTQLDAVNAEIAARAAKGGKTVGSAATQGVADGIETTTPTVEIAVADLVATLGTSMSGVLAAAKVTGAEGMAAMAAGITAARKAPLDAFETLKSMLKNAMTPMAEVARLHGELTSKALARGLRSGDPAVRAQAIAVAKAAAARLAELAAGGGKAGKAAMAELDKGIRSKIPAVRAAAIAAKNAAVAKLEAAEGPAGAAGAAAGSAFASRLQAAIKARDYRINTTVGMTIPGHSEGGVAAAGVPSWMGEKGPEIYVPEVAGRVLSHEDSMAAVSGRGSGGRGEITVNVYNPKPEPASTSTRRELRKLALSGSAL